MEKFKLTVTRKNGNKKTVAVYLDDTTAQLLKQSGDKKLIEAYLLEEYKESRRTRQEEFWNHSLDDDIGNGIDYEDKHSNSDFLFNDFSDENLQAAIKMLTPRQQEMLRLVYIEGKSQKELVEIFGIDKRSVSDAIHRIYASLKKKYKKN